MTGQSAGCKRGRPECRPCGGGCAERMALLSENPSDETGKFFGPDRATSRGADEDRGVRPSRCGQHGGTESSDRAISRPRGGSYWDHHRIPRVRDCLCGSYCYVELVKVRSRRQRRWPAVVALPTTKLDWRKKVAMPKSRAARATILVCPRRARASAEPRT